jgi:hypothetical protein
MEKGYGYIKCSKGVVRKTLRGIPPVPTKRAVSGEKFFEKVSSPGRDVL